jgi:phospholipase C
MHTRPNSVANIGTSGDGANHQYDLHDFFDALAVGKMPAASFLKAIAAEDGQAGYSDPLLEQRFLVRTVNAICAPASGRAPPSSFCTTTLTAGTTTSLDEPDHQFLGGLECRSTKRVGCLRPRHTPRRDRGALRARSATAVPRDLAVRQTELRRSHADRSKLRPRFIEDNWGTGRIGGGSFDALAGPLTNMFDFDDREFGEHISGERRLLLDEETGEPR